MLLRFQNIFDKQEDGDQVLINVDKMFTEFDVESLEETTLAANQPLKHKHAKSYIAGLEFDLNPGEIRTFVANIVKK